jgi:EmrB/QacA subfamily drug resistance transporter
MVVAALMDLVDTTIVNVALPSIQHDLHASGAQLEWMISAYVLAIAVTLISTGRVGDLVGRRRMFLTGVGLFAAASLSAALAQRPGELIASRAVQGFAAAIIIPQVLGTFRAAFGERERRSAFATYGVFAGLAAIAGVLLGGVLTSADVLGTGWRAIFLVNVPVAAIVLAAAVPVVPETRASSASRPDLAGNLLLLASLLVIMYPLLQGRELGWPPWSFALVAGGVVGLVLLAAIEARRRDLSIAPLVQPRLLRIPAFGVGLAVQMLSSAGLLALLFVLTLWLQEGQGFSPLQTGIILVSFATGGFVVGGVAMPLAARLGRVALIAGALSTAGGSALLLLASREPVHGLAASQLVPPLLLAGAGLGMLTVPLVNVVLASVPDRDAAGASGVFTTGQQLGAAIGVAVVGQLFFSSAADHGYGHALHESLSLISAGFLLCAVLCLGLPPARHHAAD